MTLGASLCVCVSASCGRPSRSSRSHRVWSISLLPEGSISSSSDNLTFHQPGVSTVIHRLSPPRAELCCCAGPSSCLPHRVFALLLTITAAAFCGCGVCVCMRVCVCVFLCVPGFVWVCVWLTTFTFIPRGVKSISIPKPTAGTHIGRSEHTHTHTAGRPSASASHIWADGSGGMRADRHVRPPTPSPTAASCVQSQQPDPRRVIYHQRASWQIG